MTILYDNRFHNFSGNSDLFGTSIKAETIKSMLENNNEYFDKNNMIALYGDWGSGKTSVMKYIENNITDYNVLFFEAWKYEKDSNLSLSLFEALLDKFESDKGVSEKIFEEAKLFGKTLLSMGKNILLNYKIPLLGVTFNIDQAAKDTLNEMEKLIERTSFYSTLNKFNSSYKKLLEEYYNRDNNNNKKLLVFIDDLDRCSPENVLELISSIKHFFVDSDKVVYFCGIDKHAVSRAIAIRYNEIIKSEEYLEKVFDVTFNMPEIQDMNNVIDDFISKINSFNPVPHAENRLEEFFLDIKLTNPRKLKKLFNKYLFLCTLDKNNQSQNRVYEFIPENFKEHAPIQMVFTLYIILLYEFHREIFELIYNWQTKLGKLRNIFDNKEFYIQSNESKPMYSYLNELDKKWKDSKPKLLINSNIVHNYLETTRDNTLIELLLLFLPLDTKVNVPEFNASEDGKLLDQWESFIYEFRSSDEKILKSFISFIPSLFMFTYRNKSEFNVFDIFKMVSFYL
ncbi:P-loop NTPase fold protein [Peribacillus frigoritolerans]|uniref:KAP family P-loop NTPase fold protein n=1 Tax=Peribacillus frigoritolerans TaxID=450367 RepID=UPI002E228B2A|nr:P-loop NTPase fold protein [Peribacillus frigoritolerans]